MKQENIYLNLEKKGKADGKFKSPWGIGIDKNGNIIVSDYGNNRVQVFDKTGNYFLKFGKKGKDDGQMKKPYGIGIDRTGNIVVADSGNKRIQVFYFH